MICSKCGYEIDDQAPFCPYCGQGVNRSDGYERSAEVLYERSPQGSGYRTRPRPPVITLEDLPPELKPMSAWSYVGWGILFALPLAGIVLVIVFSCVSGNINRKRFARSYLCWLLIAAVIVAILLLTGKLVWNDLVNGQFFGLKLW